ncbi:hypothetical protein D3C75_1315550 [compost metagenome]
MKLSRYSVVGKDKASLIISALLLKADMILKKIGKKKMTATKRVNVKIKTSIISPRVFIFITVPPLSSGGTSLE